MTRLIVILGGIWGLLLAYIALILAGGGHGFVGYMLLVSAPLSLPMGGMAILVLPFQTAALAWLAGSRHRKVFLWVIFTHYLVGTGLMAYCFRDDFLDEYRSVPKFLYYDLVVGVSLYLLGQLGLWFIYIRRSISEQQAIMK